MSTIVSTRLRTMVDVLRDHADARPDKLAYAFLPEQASDPLQQLDYQGLVQSSARIAAGLDRWFAAHVDAPRMALLLFPAGLDFLQAFWGCLNGRVIAIPAAMPRPGRAGTVLEALIANAGVRLVLTDEASLPTVRRILDSAPALAGLDTLTIDEVAADGEGRTTTIVPREDDIAFLQYTSGSTSTPKGVVVRHRNLLANEKMITAGMRLDRESTMVIWVPHYHDMGLIGGMLQPIHTGAGCYMLAPTTFLKRPIRWLKAISDYGGVIGGGPDFGYRLCIERIGPEQAAELDLSSWRVAFTGAEPVRAATLTSFSERFAVSQFQGAAFHPCYGMAEVTLLSNCAGPDAMVQAISPAGLAAGRAEAPRAGEIPAYMVCAGGPILEARIAIVDPTTLRRCPDGVVGEIWHAGPHVADGYFNDTERTDVAFGAAIAGEDGAGSWLRSGDLGYVVDGGLYITGRLKEMMIVNGRNLYPHDIQDALRGRLSEIRDSAVFAVPEGNGAERIVAILELAASHRRLILQSGEENEHALHEIARTARMICAQDCELPLDHVRIALPGAVMKTTSGKTRYGDLRAWFAAQPDDVRAAAMSVETDRFQREDA